MSNNGHYEDLPEGASFVGAISAVRRRWPLVLTIVLACVVVAVVHSVRSTKTYKATANVAFQSSSPSDSALGVSSGGSTEPQREANTEVLKAHSAEVARKVASQLHLSTSVNSLLTEVQVEVAPTADVLNVIASTSDPVESARLANAFAEQYIAFRTETELEGIGAAEANLQKQIEALPQGSEERATLVQSLQRLGALRATAGGSATIIGRASVPDSPAGTTLTSWVIIGLLVGIATASLTVFFIESLDRRVRSPEQFEHEYKLSALAVVPNSAFRERLAASRTTELEPYRMLRSALEFTAAARPLRSILVTSAVSGEGKTTVAVDFAHATALAGRNTILVEMDLRRPTFATHFGLAAGGGVSAALVGHSSAGELLIEPFTQLPTLRVLPAGRLPHNPAELLGSDRITEIIHELRQLAEVVVIDVPPLNPVADAQLLLNSAAVDGVLVVGRLDRVRRDDVRRARAILDHHAVEPVGIVVVGATGMQAYGGKYGYPPNGELSTPAQRYRESGGASRPGDLARPISVATHDSLAT